MFGLLGVACALELLRTAAASNSPGSWGKVSHVAFTCQLMTTSLTSDRPGTQGGLMYLMGARAQNTSSPNSSEASVLHSSAF